MPQALVYLGLFGLSDGREQQHAIELRQDSQDVIAGEHRGKVDDDNMRLVSPPDILENVSQEARTHQFRRMPCRRSWNDCQMMVAFSPDVDRSVPQCDLTLEQAQQSTGPTVQAQTVCHLWFLQIG